MAGWASSSGDGGRPAQPGELDGHIHCLGEGSDPGFLDLGKAEETMQIESSSESFGNV